MDCSGRVSIKRRGVILLIIKAELKKLLSHKEVYAAWIMVGALMILQFVIEFSDEGWTVWDKILMNVYGISPYIAAILIAVGLCGMFSYEREDGMTGVLRVCKKGQYKTLLSKLAASIVYIVFIEMIMLSVQIIVYGITYGFGGLTLPTGRYHIVPVGMAVGVQVILTYLYSSLGAVAFGAMVLLFSTALKPAHTAALSGGIFVAVELLYRQWTIQQLLSPVSNFILDLSFNNIMNAGHFSGMTWGELLHCFLYPAVLAPLIFAVASVSYYKTRYRA